MLKVLHDAGTLHCRVDTGQSQPSLHGQSSLLCLELLCYTVLHITHCYTLLHSVTVCYTLLHSVTNGYTVLKSVTQRFTVLHSVTQCYTVLYSKVFDMLHCESQFVMQYQASAVLFCVPCSVYCVPCTVIFLIIR